jgi:sugar phosphate permease
MGPPAFEPSMTNWTVPVGVTVAGETGATFAVKVTLCPLADGFADEVTVIALLAFATPVSTVFEVLFGLVESPVPVVATVALLCNVVPAAEEATVTRMVKTWFAPEARPVLFV